MDKAIPSRSFEGQVAFLKVNPIFDPRNQKSMSIIGDLRNYYLTLTTDHSNIKYKMIFLLAKFRCPIKKYIELKIP